MFNLYKKRDKESIETIARYCVVDLLLTIALFDNMNIWVSVIEMPNVTRIRIWDLYTRGQQIRVKSQLYKECYDKNVIFNKTESLLEEFKYEKAIVSNPMHGFYKWCSLLNFSSLYPCVILIYNIYYSTFI